MLRFGALTGFGVISFVEDLYSFFVLGGVFLAEIRMEVKRGKIFGAESLGFREVYYFYTISFSPYSFNK